MSKSYGWHSAEQAASTHTVYVYDTPDGEVEVTEVTTRADYAPPWADAKSLGEVGRFLRREPQDDGLASVDVPDVTVPEPQVPPMSQSAIAAISRTAGGVPKLTPEQKDELEAAADLALPEPAAKPLAAQEAGVPLPKPQVRPVVAAPPDSTSLDDLIGSLEDI